MTRNEEMVTKREEITLAAFLVAMAAFTMYCSWVIYTSWEWIVF